MDVVSVDPDPKVMRVIGKDVLNVRLVDGTAKQFAPLADFSADARFIEKWRFADGGPSVIIQSRSYHGPAFYGKYDTRTGKLIHEIGTYTPFSKLPAWAKPVADESSKE